MLITRRRPGQSLTITVGEVVIRVRFLAYGPPSSGIVLGTEAPPEVEIWRDELLPEDKLRHDPFLHRSGT